MSWDRIKGNWKQFKGRARQQWGKLTDDELDQIEGRREELVGSCRLHGIAKVPRLDLLTVNHSRAQRSHLFDGGACFVRLRRPDNALAGVEEQLITCLLNFLVLRMTG
jgi:hypothetical protein